VHNDIEESNTNDYVRFINSNWVSTGVSVQYTKHKHYTKKTIKQVIQGRDEELKRRIE
jgi:hypothetical protein